MVVNAQYAVDISHWTFMPVMFFWLSVLAFPFVSGILDALDIDGWSVSAGIFDSNDIG